MIEGSCHCGAIRLRVPTVPDQLSACNCSICRRLGTLMAYYDPADVELEAEPGATVAYVWGDRKIAFHHCATCGCTSHWESLDPALQDRMGINARLFAPTDIERARIRRFDGAETWTFLD